MACAALIGVALFHLLDELKLRISNNLFSCSIYVGCLVPTYFRVLRPLDDHI